MRLKENNFISLRTIYYTQIDAKTDCEIDIVNALNNSFIIIGNETNKKALSFLF